MNIGILIDQEQPEITQAINIMICWHKIIQKEKIDYIITRKTMSEKVSEICNRELVNRDVAFRGKYNEDMVILLAV